MENLSVQQIRLLNDEQFKEYTVNVGLLHAQFRMRIGKILVVARSKYEDPVEFSRWYGGLFDIDGPTATKYMRIAERYADSAWEDMGYSAQLKLTTMTGDPDMVKECREHFEKAHIGGGKVTAMKIQGWVDAYNYERQREQEFEQHGAAMEHREEVIEQAPAKSAERQELRDKVAEEAAQREHNKAHFKRQEQQTNQQEAQHKGYLQYKQALMTLGLGGATDETVGIVLNHLTSALAAKYPERTQELQNAKAAVNDHLNPAPELKVVNGG